MREIIKWKCRNCKFGQRLCIGRRFSECWRCPFVLRYFALCLQAVLYAFYGLSITIKHAFNGFWRFDIKQPLYASVGTHPSFPDHSIAPRKSSVHIWEPFHWNRTNQSILRRSEVTQDQCNHFETIWIDLSLFRIMGFHTRHIPFHSIEFQQFQVDWNLGVSFTKDLSRFDHFWAILHAFQFVLSIKAFIAFVLSCRFVVELF